MIELLSLRRINAKTFDLGGGQRRLSTSIGVLHYPDNLGVLQDCDDSYSESDTGGFSAKFTKCLSHVRIKDNGARRIYPDRNDLSYWIQIEKPDGITMGTPIKTGNTWVWDFLHAQIRIQMQSSQVKFSFILKDLLAPTSITIPFSVQGITRTGNILYHDGIPAAELSKPIAIDANYERRDVTATFNVGSVTLTLDPTGLTYPINIDPTVNVRVASDNADVVRRLSPALYTVTAAVYEAAGQWANTDRQWGSGMVFTNITIPNAATINSATITGRAERTTTRDAERVCKTRFHGEAADNPADYNGVGQAAFDTRRANKTTAIVDWDGIPGWTISSDYTSPSLVTIIQELVNRAGWASGNNMAIYWNDWDYRSTGDGSGSFCGLATWLDYYSSSTNCPIIDITYTAAVGSVAKINNPKFSNMDRLLPRP